MPLLSLESTMEKLTRPPKPQAIRIKRYHRTTRTPTAPPQLAQDTRNAPPEPSAPPPLIPRLSRARQDLPTCPPPEPRTCEICGQPFDYITLWQLFCSKRCAARAASRRFRARGRAAQRATQL